MVTISKKIVFPTPQYTPPQKGQSLFRSTAGKVGEGAQSALSGAVRTAFDGTKWAAKKCFVKALDVTAWVAKGAIIASLATTAVTAVGASISPTLTLKIVDSVATTLGATPRAAGDVKLMGDVVIIQAKYMGELLGLALKTGIEVGAKTVVHTARAIVDHVVVPMAQGFAGSMAQGASSAWKATASFFKFW
jgi:hypothetical protein